ncbi:sugar ABC transporter permease [Desulfitobacterium sp.]|uniref:carbohydrate ABC transporter permease n=1 Tax=Desulfitobacterium sp. TaxID=49981 RepID=UPI002D1B15F1|nr:sugar ABC transporter permease [Desulfitobacterium sp.]HVJ47947.1 sugar ABC transporter permease [Desulfitobacterium sp.]
MHPKKSWKEFFTALLYLSPSLLIFMIFIFYPMVKTVYLSLYLTNPHGDAVVWKGLQNYIVLFSSETFRKSLVASLLFVLYTVPETIVLGLAFAVSANVKLRGIGIFRTLYSSTIGVSVASASTIWMFLFSSGNNGMFNYVLSSLGLSKIGWLVTSQTALPAIALMTIWMGVGFNFIVLIGGLQSLPEEVYESARIDGAGWWKQLRYITIPMLSPTLFFLIIVDTINAFQAFGQFNILTQGGPDNATNVLVHSIYREAFFNSRFGPASAQAVILFFIILILTLVQFKMGEKKVHYQ